MASQIQAGQLLVAGTGPGQLDQYYGLSDTTQTTVVASSFANLCTPYVIPAGEANYACAAYELSCCGFGTWGSTQQALSFQMFLGTGFGGPPPVSSTAFPVSQAFHFSLTMSLTCTDGISQWWGDVLGAVIESSVAVAPGTPATNAVPIAGVNTTVHAAAASGALTAVIQAHWNSTTGAPTLTNIKTRWKKVA